MQDCLCGCAKHFSNAFARIASSAGGPNSIAPFSLAQLNFNPSAYAHIEFSNECGVRSNTPTVSNVYKVLTTYIASNLIPEDATSFSAEDKRASTKIILRLGLGNFRFLWKDNTFRCLHQRSTFDDNAVSLVLFAKRGGKEDAHVLLQNMCEELLKRSEKPIESGKEYELDVLVYKWDGRDWEEEAAVMGRAMSSIVLPEETEKRLITDLEEFLSEGTKQFYQQHGIPLRRSYLLHGVPGSGKTSLIQAVANKYHKCLCYLTPSDPGMSDESLRSAVASVPENAVVVIEDIDALFTGSRKKESAIMDNDDQWGIGSSLMSAVTASRVTMSGLLNALDGIGTASGQIVFLTTNHRENLDPALIRPGRVDLHIEFKHATREQIKKMWSAFYSKDQDIADEFADRLNAVLHGQQIATAALQHFFIKMRRKSGQEALLCVSEISNELEERGISTSGGEDHGSIERQGGSGWIFSRLSGCSQVNTATPERIEGN